TLFSVLLFYRREIGALIRGVLGRGEEPAGQRLLLFHLVLGTLPAAVVGLLFQDPIEAAFSTPAFAAVALLVTGTVLWSSRGFKAAAGSAGEGRSLDARMALLIGLAQAVAIAPGISRSGMTIVAGLALGLSGERSAAFSFLLSIPAILGAVVLKAPELLENGAGSLGPLELSFGVLVSFGVGFLALGMLIWLIRRQKLSAFAPYCWLVGALGLLGVLVA
ncbi:MAG: undecaprenyl-diphosphate phosphatase, partial [Planctomycetota bacterium]